MADFEFAVESWAAVLAKLKTRGVQYLVFGMDATAELASDWHDRAGPEVALRLLSRVSDAYEQRGQLLLSVLKRFDLVTANTWLSQEDWFTRRPWMETQRCTQIDFILVSRQLSHRSWARNEPAWGRSDHFPMFSALEVPSAVLLTKGEFQRSTTV